MATINTRTRVGLSMFVAAGVLTTATALAMDVTGSVRAAPDYVARVRRAQPAQHAYYWEEWNGFLEPRPDVLDLPRELAVVLVGNGPEPANHNVTIQWRGGSLLPSTIVVRPGTILAIENHDDVIHELSSPGMGEIAAEATGAGSTRRTLALSRPGHYLLTDSLVPHATGHLHVVANVVAVAKPDANGAFTFSDVAAGQYTLKIFHGEREVSTRPIEVVEGHALTVDPLTLTASN